MQIVRVCTWNIHYGLELPTILDSITTFKEFENIDIFALQESSITESQGEMAAEIAKKLGKNYQSFQFSTPKNKNVTWGNAVIWNTKTVSITNKDVLILPPFYSVNLSRIERNIIRLMTKSIRTSVRIEGTIHGKSFRFYSAHFDVIGYRHKRLQFEYLLKDNISRGKKDIKIIAGDLNTFKILRRPRWLKIRNDAAEHGFSDITSNIRWTFARRRLRFKQKLDAVFIKHNFPVSYYSWSNEIPGSDHIPVFANLTFN